MRSHTDITKFLQCLKETPARPITKQILHYLSNEDQLRLRQSCHTWQAIIAQQVNIPYATQQQFLLSVSGIFNQQVHFDMAWTLYARTHHAHSLQAAALYKQKDWDNLFHSGKIKDFAGDEHLANMGRLYCPKDAHLWSVNQVWLLAQYHKHRPIKVLSELNAEVKLSDQPPKYSAFACEVALTLQAGYRIVAVEGYDVTLAPPPSSEVPVSLQQLRLDVSVITASILRVNGAIEQHFKAMKAAQRVAEIWLSLKSLERDSLYALREALLTQANHWDVYFHDVVDTTYTCQTIVKVLTKQGINIDAQRMSDVATTLTNAFLAKINTSLASPTLIP